MPFQSSGELDLVNLADLLIRGVTFYEWKSGFGVKRMVLSGFEWLIDDMRKWFWSQHGRWRI